MEKVTYVCAATGKREEGSPNKMPNGWILPPRDVARDVPKEPLPRGTVLALSSEEAWQQYWKGLVDATLGR